MTPEVERVRRLCEAQQSYCMYPDCDGCGFATPAAGPSPAGREVPPPMTPEDLATKILTDLEYEHTSVEVRYLAKFLRAADGQRQGRAELIEALRKWGADHTSIPTPILNATEHGLCAVMRAAADMLAGEKP